jgi:hypothetical protein
MEMLRHQSMAQEWIGKEVTAIVAKKSPGQEGAMLAMTKSLGIQRRIP